VPGLDKIYDFYSFHLIPRIGKMVVGEAEPYQYLVESIRRFPNRTVFADMIRDAGFARVTATPMTGGVVALHSGWKV
jgi:demethylmenaquinone methyltransferase/2-methoxy-6-polyprenyl-1,4-benzoquinol methylase